MLKKYLLIGILAITIAQAISAFSWISINKSSGLLVGQSKSLIISDKGERDSISPGLQQAGQIQRLVGTADIPPCLSPYPTTFSPSLLVVSQYVDDHYPVLSSPSLVDTAGVAPCLSPYPFTFSPYLVVAGQYVDDHYPVLASSYLVVVGTYHDR